MNKMAPQLKETFEKMANALPEEQQPLFMALTAYRLGNKGTTHAASLGWDVKTIRQGQRKLNQWIQEDKSVRQRKALKRFYRSNKNDKKPKKDNESQEKPDLNFARAISRQGSDFSDLKAAGGNFRQSTIIGANLSEAILTGADLWNVNWNNNYLAGATLSFIQAKYSKFEYCIFRNADLTGADLTGSWFTGSDLTGCDLRGANLTGTSLWGVCLRNAEIDDSTMLAGARINKETYELSDWSLSDLKKYYQRGLVIKDLGSFPGEVWQQLFDSSSMSIAHIYIKRLISGDRKSLALAFSGLCAILAKMDQPIMLRHYIHRDEGKNGEQVSYGKEKIGYVFLLQSKSLTGLDLILELLDQNDESFTKRLREMLPTEPSVLTEEAIQKIAEYMSPQNVEVDPWKLDGETITRIDRPETRLRKFLMDAFNEDELTTFIEDLEGGKEITANASRKTFERYVIDIIGAMQRRGKFNDGFFRELKRIRGGKRDKVNEIECHFQDVQEDY